MADGSKLQPRFIDAHCHLQVRCATSLRYRNSNLSTCQRVCVLQDARLSHCLRTVMREAREVGLQGFSVNGCGESDWDKVLAQQALYSCCALTEAYMTRCRLLGSGATARH